MSHSSKASNNVKASGSKATVNNPNVAERQKAQAIVNAVVKTSPQYTLIAYCHGYKRLNEKLNSSPIGIDARLNLFNKDGQMVNRLARLNLGSLMTVPSTIEVKMTFSSERSYFVTGAYTPSNNIWTVTGGLNVDGKEIPSGKVFEGSKAKVKNSARFQFNQFIVDALPLISGEFEHTTKVKTQGKSRVLLTAQFEACKAEISDLAELIITRQADNKPVESDFKRLASLKARRGKLSDALQSLTDEVKALKVDAAKLAKLIE